MQADCTLSAHVRTRVRFFYFRRALLTSYGALAAPITHRATQSGFVGLCGFSAFGALFASRPMVRLIYNSQDSLLPYDPYIFQEQVSISMPSDRTTLVNGYVQNFPLGVFIPCRSSQQSFDFELTRAHVPRLALRLLLGNERRKPQRSQRRHLSHLLLRQPLLPHCQRRHGVLPGATKSALALAFGTFLKDLALVRSIYSAFCMV